jgi:putative transposase
MTWDLASHQRRSLRLAGYDYRRPGVYYLTICAADRACTFGRMDGGKVRVSSVGKMVAEEWVRSCEVRPEMALDDWVLMPNHLHGIVTITAGAHRHAPLPLGLRWPEGKLPFDSAPLHRPSRSLGSFVAGFKGAVTRRVIAMKGSQITPVWQRGYYEHVVRDEDDLERVREYIRENPRRWAEDTENPESRGAWQCARSLR